MVAGRAARLRPHRPGRGVLAIHVPMTEAGHATTAFEPLVTHPPA